ncbi:MAG: DUF2892 domain-containing protein [Candidatus Nanoarchaeia archaeon]|jgi:hypothetical protein
MDFKNNEGKIDRIIRAILGLAAIALGYIYSVWIYLLAALLLVTAADGYCFIYDLLKINTLGKKKKK